MSRKQEPERYTEPCKCRVCTDCRRDPVTRRCEFGGPFGGYVEVKTEEPKQ